VSSRRRGRIEDEDVRQLLDQNKRLRRKLASLTKQNRRVRKDRDKWRGQADQVSGPDEAPQAAQPIRTPVLGVTCKHCGSQDVNAFELEVRGEVRRYFSCLNQGCKKRGRV
jgi:hypothetical protein